MAETPSLTLRVRHYTRLSSKESIIVENRVLARDQNKVFVELANRKPLNPREAEAKYLIKRGKGNAYIEFDARVEAVQTNRLTGDIELF